MAICILWCNVIMYMPALWNFQKVDFKLCYASKKKKKIKIKKKFKKIKINYNKIKKHTHTHTHTKQSLAWQHMKVYCVSCFFYGPCALLASVTGVQWPVVRCSVDYTTAFEAEPVHKQLLLLHLFWVDQFGITPSGANITSSAGQTRHSKHFHQWCDEGRSTCRT